MAARAVHSNAFETSKNSNFLVASMLIIIINLYRFSISFALYYWNAVSKQLSICSRKKASYSLHLANYRHWLKIICIDWMSAIRRKYKVSLAGAAIAFGIGSHYSSRHFRYEKKMVRIEHGNEKRMSLTAHDAVVPHTNSILFIFSKIAQKSRVQFDRCRLLFHFSFFFSLAFLHAAREWNKQQQQQKASLDIFCGLNFSFLYFHQFLQPFTCVVSCEWNVKNMYSLCDI